MQGFFIALFWLSLLAFIVSLVALVVAAVKKTGKVKRYVWVLAGSVVCFFVAVAGVEPAETGLSNTVQSDTAEANVESNKSDGEAVVATETQRATNAQISDAKLFLDQVSNLTAEAEKLWREFKVHLEKVESGEEEPAILKDYKYKITAVCDEIFNLPVDGLMGEEREAAERLKDIMASAYFELAKAAGYYYNWYDYGSQESLDQAKKRIQHFYEELEDTKEFIDKLEN